MTLRDAACGYALDYGWSIFPLLPGSKRPHGLLVPRGMDEASNKPVDALYWWEREPKANIGLACRASGLLVLDIDPRHGGDKAMAFLRERLSPLPGTMTNHTPTGGYHYLFKHPNPDFEFRKEIAIGVDIKDRGYIVLPPSVREMGSYEWEWSDEGVAELPDDWIDTGLRKDAPREKRARSDSPLMLVSAEDYVEILTGRQAHGKWVCCPFHKDGQERTPSFKVQGSMWSCFGCEPKWGKRVLGGNILDFAGLLWDYPMPLAGADLMECKARVEKELRDAREYDHQHEPDQV